jgi:site-specific DNA-methyltransferase (adenine-specific)
MIYAKKHQVPLSHNRYEQFFEYMFVFSKGKPKTFNPIKVECKTAGHIVKGIPAKEKARIKTGENKLRIQRKTTKTNKTKIRGNIWVYSPVSKAKHSHPASFPEQLAIDHINSWSNKGDLVYDPCMGSGTVAEACIRLGRDYIGSEMSKEYYDAIQNRIYFVNKKEGK